MPGRPGTLFVVIAVALTVAVGLNHDGATATTCGPAPARASVPDTSVGAVVGDDASTEVSVSDDARYVGFVSKASNLIVDDVNGTSDVFVRDRVLTTTERVSLPDPATGATESNGPSADVSIRGAGDLVAFQSSASNLVVGDSNRRRDIFVRDRSAGTTELVSVDMSGVPNGRSDPGVDYVHQRPHLSGDGRFVAWETVKSVFGIPQWSRVFLRDRGAGTTELVSRSTGGTTGNNFSFAGNVSFDGTYVAFTSTATNLVPGSTGLLKPDAFVRDRAAGTTERVSVNAAGVNGDKESVVSLSGRGYAMSADGRYVVFRSNATNLVADDTNNKWDAFVHDRATGETERVSVASNGDEADGKSEVVTISLDGRFVSFQSLATNLDTVDTDDFWDAYLHDRTTAATRAVSVNSACEPADSSALDDPAISGDGSHIVFHTRATNLDAADTNATNDVYIVATDGAVVAPPDVTEISPATGDTAGGSEVSITGSGFTGATSVDFGDEPATSFSVESGTEITAVVPPQPAGAVDVIVTTPAGTSPASAGSLFVYEAPGGDVDTVDVQITGSVNYSNSGPITDGDLVVNPPSGGVNSVTGTGTLSSPVGGDALVRFNVTLALGIIHVGSVRVVDPGAGIDIRTPILTTVSRAEGTNAARGAMTWFDLSTFPFLRTYRLVWTVDDRN